MGLVLIIWQLDSIYTLLLVNFVSIYSNNVFLYGAQLTIKILSPCDGATHTGNSPSLIIPFWGCPHRYTQRGFHDVLNQSV